MKKRVFRKKKKIKIYRARKRMERALFLAAAVCLLAGMALTVHGKEVNDTQEADTQETVMQEMDVQASKEVITEIYHKHAGNSEKEGGCYSIPIAHHHQGDEKTGGPCYQTEVKHIHQGNESESGGCYTKPEYHQHQGDEQQGGPCYEAVTHVHSDACYQQETCLVHHTLVGDVLETWMDFCFSHQDTLYGRSAGIASHGSCGAGEEERFYRYCLTCGTIGPTTHSYQKLICQTQEGTITGYQLSCTKDDKTIDRYVTDCGFKELEGEGFALSCTRTVDGYKTGCGLEENSLCGRVILTNETEGQAEQVVIRAHLTDFTGGKLKPSVPAFEWRNERGELAGTGEKITVNENGRYSVLVRLENKDVDEAGLNSSILVDNVHKVQSAATPTPADRETDVSDGQEQETSALPAEEDETTESNLQSPVPQASIAPQNTDNTEDQGSMTLSVDKKRKAGEQEKASLWPAPTKPPVIKEIQRVKVEENEAQEEITYVVAQKEKDISFFDIPSVRIISVAGGVLLLIGGLLLLLFYLRNSVRLFNDDGEGRMVRLGRCRVKAEDECYSVTITEAMVEKAFTNRYCIKPGLFLLGKKEGQELVVYKDTKSVSVYLNREMIIVI